MALKLYRQNAWSGHGDSGKPCKEVYRVTAASTTLMSSFDTSAFIEKFDGGSSSNSRVKLHVFM